MPTYVLTINGVAKPLRLQSLRINESANGRNTCTFDIYSALAAYRPEIDDEVIITEDAVRIFGGHINAPAEEGVGRGDIITKCSAVDFNALIDRRVLNIEVPAGTLKQALQALVPYLTPYGVALDVAQVNGPAILAQHFYFTTLRRAFELLADQTDYVFEIDYNKTLRMFQPSAVAAPFSITTLNRNAIGDITVEPTREDYANRIIVLGGTGMLAKSETFTAPGTSADVVLNYTMVGNAGYVTYGGNAETLGPVGDPGNPTWTWSTTGGVTTITRTTGNPTGAVTIDYTAHFPKLVYSDSSPIWTADTLVERIVPYPDVFDVDVLQELSDKMVARTSLERKRVTYTTAQTGIHPGMTQTMTVAERQLSGTYTITDVSIDNPAGEHVLRHVTAIEGDTYLMASWQDDVATWGRDMAIGGGAAVMQPGAAPMPSQSAAPPFKSLQFNRSGTFGGSPSLLFEEDTNSLIAGLGSSITADTYDHCYIFGPNGTITNP